METLSTRGISNERRRTEFLRKVFIGFQESVNENKEVQQVVYSTLSLYRS